MAHPWTQAVSRFCHQYLQLETFLDYPQRSWLRLAEVQNAIYDRLFADGVLSHAPPARYRLRVLKELVSRVEDGIDDWENHDVSDDLMSALSVLLSCPLPPESGPVQQKCHVTYYLSSLSSSSPSSSSEKLGTVQDKSITLLENRSLLAASGTTGLRTWEAALHLGQYLCQNSTIIKDRHVLELGAGTGYLSILCAKYLGAAHVLALDGSDDVINNLPENLFLNDLQGSPRIRPMELKWGHGLLATEEEQWNGGRAVDVVIGADITYDDSVMPALVGTLIDVFAVYPLVVMYISVVRRNAQTAQVFLERCRLNSLVVEDVRYEVAPRDQQDGPFYSDQAAIRIYKISA